MNKSVKRILCLGLMALMLVSLAACAGRNIPSVTEGTADEEYVLKRVGNHLTTQEYDYTDEGVKQSPVDTFVSGDGLCTIVVFPDYFDVTLDYEKGTPEQVGAAYAKTVMKAVPDYAATVEPYIYENIRLAFSAQAIDYSVLEERMTVLLESLPEEYAAEIRAFAEAISGGERGFQENGILSYEEAILVQMVPDALRPTACSALSLWGSKTETGEGITLRCLEWNLGSENQMGRMNAVMHMVKGERSITSIGLLGILDMISAVNDDGVFAAILDVGASKYPFVYEGKLCYTYAIRYALEEFDSAQAVGEYMVAHSGEFTWCHNLIITDAEHSYCAENCVREVAQAGDGFSVLRDADTPILEGLHWENPDSLCVLNSFMTEGNMDSFTGFQSNLVRFRKYNDWVASREKFTLAEVKQMITQEQTGETDLVTVHSANTVHIVLIDYASRTVQVAFTGADGVEDKPVFLDVGGF